MSEAQRPVLEDDEQPVDPERESAYGTSRLMAFSDGVFSIAITLLVLDVPRHLARAVRRGRTSPAARNGRGDPRGDASAAKGRQRRVQ